MIGAYIGMRSRCVRDLSRSHNDHASARDVLEISICKSWTTSLTAFGLMNAVALAHHCLLPPPKTYEDSKIHRKPFDNFLWAADCFFTGASSLHLTIMALLVYRLHGEKKNSIDVASLNRSMARMRRIANMSLISLAGSLSLLYHFFRYGRTDLWKAAGTFTEMIYLFPLASATLFLLPLVIHSALKLGSVDGSVAGARLAILGGLVILISLPLDSSLCYFVSSSAPSLKTSPLFYDLYHMPTLVFLGCDLSFWGLGIWLDYLLCELKGQNRKEL
jgi:hypothetical protein